MAKLRIPKLIGIAVMCFLLAGLLTLQAISSVLTRKAPEQAVVLFPANGLAKEQFAFRTFQAKVNDGAELEYAAMDALPIARFGLASDPLAPKSYAIFAVAERDLDKRNRILEFANQVNRRDLALQGLVLQKNLEAEDYRSVVDTLDQILRVHPTHHETFFPLLVDALKVREAAPIFSDILDGSAFWQKQFLLFAVNDKDARVTLASIHEDIGSRDEVFDRRLIRGLALQGEMDLARSVYDGINQPQSAGGSGLNGEWPSRFPPFDWSLEDERDFRSQPSRDGKKLDLYARSGQGGAIARRIFPTPPLPFQLAANLEMRASGRSDSVRLSLQCGNETGPSLNEVLAPGENLISVETLPEGCTHILVEVRARALRGEPTLRAELSPIRFITH